MLYDYLEHELRALAKADGQKMKIKLQEFLADYFPVSYEDPLSQRVDIVTEEVWAKAVEAGLVENMYLQRCLKAAKAIAESK